MTTTVLTSHRKVPPPGAAGGAPGACGRNAVLRANGGLVKLKGNDACEVDAGYVFLMKTPGGGGFGA